MTEDLLLIGDYELRIGRVLDILAEARVKRVLVQLPEGLKRYYPAIANSIQVKTNLEVHLDASPAYGSCLLDPRISEGYDLVIHIGHDPYPLTSYPSLKVVFVDLEYVGVDPKAFSSEVEKYLRSRGLANIAIVTTNQHKKLSKLMKEELESRGFTVVSGPSVIFGCYVPPELRRSEAEVIVVVAGGLFHSIGVGMTIRDTTVVRADPYTGSVADVSREISRFVSVRLKKMCDALEAKSWGILAGISGQYRPLVISELEKVLSKRGYNFYLYVAPILNMDALRNIDSPEIEAYIVTSCPRIAVDDLAQFEKPVLTPPEALVVLEKGEVSEYPWSFLW